MKKILLIVSSILTLGINAQNYYGSQFIGDSGLNTPSSVFKSDRGVLISGFIGGSLTGNFPITFKGGNADGVLTKLSEADGTIQWIKQFGSASDEVVIDAVMDNSGNHYLTGYFMGAGSNSFDADPGPGVYNLSVTSVLANRDIFIIKLDVNGNFLWAKQMSSPAGAPNDDVATIKLDSSGNIYLAGSYTYVDFDPGAGDQTLMASGSSGAFIVKLDNNGNFLWVKTLEGTSNKKIIDLELDGSENIYVAGRFQGNIDLNPDSTMQDLRVTAGNFDTFVAKYDSNGNYIWGLNYGGTASDTPEKILINGNDLYVGGAFTGTVDLDPTSGVSNVVSAGGQDAYLTKLTLNGDYVSSFVIPGTTSNLDSIRDIYVDATGNIYLSGLFQNITLNSNNYTANVANADAFYLKLDSSLNFSSIYLIQGDGIQSIPFIQQLADNKFLAIGSSRGVAIFNYANPISTEGNSIPQSYTYVTKFDFETTLDTNTFESQNNFSVYPNPVQSVLNIVSQNKIVSINIYNLEGRKVFGQAKSEITNVNLEILQTGTYILQMQDENGKIENRKLIKY